jgi:imidazolonepropionase
MRTLITNISTLAQVRNTADNEQVNLMVAGNEMALLPSIANAWLLTDGDSIHSFGQMATLPEINADDTIDASGCIVLPAWCDSHTHIVFAAPRNGEFVDRIKGLSYEEIARRGGGILNSANVLNQMTEDALYEQSLLRINNVMRQGTGAIEIKSGYGLSKDSELKMLRVIRKLKDTTPLTIKATLLAAHAYPMAYRDNKPAYIDMIINDLLPVVAGEGLADYMDVFCEQGFFGIPETERLLEAGWKYGLKPKIHANQLHYSGGVQVGVKHNAISVDHLECVGEAEIAALKGSNTIATLLPGAAFFLGIPYQPARKIIDGGIAVCLATDYNPGSCPSGNVPLLLSIACTQLKMTPEEAINAVTVNGAAAMELSAQMGHITIGAKANLIFTRPMTEVSQIPYDFGNNPVAAIMLNGKII